MIKNWKLVDTLTVDGQSAEIEHTGGDATIAMLDDIGGGTGTLQASPNPEDDTPDWLSVGSDGELTAVGFVGVSLPPCQLRVDLSGSTSPNLKIYYSLDPDRTKPS